MKTPIYILLISLLVSCFSIDKGNSKNLIVNENTISKLEEFKKDKIIKSQDLLDFFIDELRKQSIESLPFEMDSYLLKSNDFKGDYFDWLEDLTVNGWANKYSILNDKELLFNNATSVESINKLTAPYLDSYYYLLINESNISEYSFYKRLQPINDNIEVFLSKSVITKNENEIRGAIIKLNVFDVQKKRVISSYLIRISGIGIGDEIFIEGFEIDENYTINIKSYTSVEGESIEIKKKVSINANGYLGTEIIDVRITSKERGETIVEKFNKEIIH